MKVEDLMINDFVWYNGRNLKVAAIPNEIDTVILYELGTIGYEVGISDIKPIPITKEILEKNGFEEVTSHSYYYTDTKAEDHLTIIMSLEDDGYWRVRIVNGYEFIRVYIKYIHELQHAIKLCKINKEITL